VSKIAVAMSGGVDSSVAAALLQQRSEEIFGITMLVVPESETAVAGAAENARKVSHHLGIPHFTVDLRDEFKADIITDFCRQYQLGKTPNPCVRCNRFIKFGLLLEKARALGAGTLATGHYARVSLVNGRYLLKKGIDTRRDQSYFLNQLTQPQLSRLLFPVGELTKNEVRRRAKELNLPSAETESREICFIPDNDYRRFIKAQAGVNEAPGDIVDKDGRVLGKHAGLSFYTVGQRHGLGIAAPQPLYVVKINTLHNRVVLGVKNDLLASGCTVGNINWIAIEPPSVETTALVKIRYQHPGAVTRISPLPGRRARVDFETPQSAVTPGQAVVFYDGDVVLGGGTIEETIS